MNNLGLVTLLNRFVELRWANLPGQEPAAKFLAAYFGGLEYPEIRDDILRRVPELLPGAIRLLSSSEESWVKALRESMMSDADLPFPDITKVGAGKVGDVDYWVGLIGEIFGSVASYSPDIRPDIREVLLAERRLAVARFFGFADAVGRNGLYAIIADHAEPVLTGEFGWTTMTSRREPHKLTLTFTQHGGLNTGRAEFVIPTEPPGQGYYGGQLASCDTDIVTVLEMLQIVMLQWPQTADAQAHAFNADNVHLLDVEH